MIGLIQTLGRCNARRARINMINGELHCLKEGFRNQTFRVQETKTGDFIKKQMSQLAVVSSNSWVVDNLRKRLYKRRM